MGPVILKEFAYELWLIEFRLISSWIIVEHEFEKELRLQLRNRHHVALVSNTLAHGVLTHCPVGEAQHLTGNAQRLKTSLGQTTTKGACEVPTFLENNTSG